VRAFFLPVQSFLPAGCFEEDASMECESPGSLNRPKTKIPLAVEETLSGVILAVLALLTFANVVVRYLTSFSFAFTEEFSIFLMVAMTLLGSSSLMAKRGHLSINYFVDKLPPRFRRVTTIGTMALSAFTFLLLTILGARMAWDEYRFEVTSPGLGIPTWVYTIWLPILFLAILGRAVGVIVRMWRGNE
jgi:TRAP-type C4-dicarboxylate transport system permease small subunit